MAISSSVTLPFARVSQARDSEGFSWHNRYTRCPYSSAGQGNYRSKNLLHSSGWGPQRHSNGEQSVRAIQMLPLVTGHFGQSGTNSGNWPYSTCYGVPSLPTGSNPVKKAILCYLWTDAVANSEKLTEKHMLSGGR